MSSQQMIPDQHPVAAFYQRLDTRLDDVVAMGVMTMTPEELRETLVLQAQTRAKEDALILKVLAQAETSGACQEAGAADAGGYVAKETRQTRKDARADLALAQRLETMTALPAGMAAGVVNIAQARVIIRAVDSLPSSGEFVVSAEQRLQAEEYLVAQAATHDAKALAALGHRIFEVICPDLAEAHEGTKLEAEEARAARKTTFTMLEDHQGICHGHFRLPAVQAAMLRKALQSLTNPTRFNSITGSGIDPDLPQAVRQGIGLGQLVEAIEAHWLPTSGGVGATVVVTMTLDQLSDRLEAAGVCTLDTGHRISASQARRLACRAGIIPLVLGGPSVVLDAGRKTRFASEQQRIALGIRDTHCTAEDCDVPASMCHAHHNTPYSQGGRTDVKNMRLLCGHHHRRIHDPRYRHETLTNGKVRYHLRC